MHVDACGLACVVGDGPLGGAGRERADRVGVHVALAERLGEPVDVLVVERDRLGDDLADRFGCHGVLPDRWLVNVTFTA
ncbi:hypothetical protein AB1285_27430 [Microbacterium sp. NRRL B-14842]|uniref:hypothetical protein n=1 Tax=Microbacterium sp. NRRL B-14842 TaxID=3162881 RepID=UPI003D2B0039